MLNIQPFDSFIKRHVGNSTMETENMLKTIGVDSLDTLIEETVPASIRLQKPLNVPEAMTEYTYLNHVRGIADKNNVFKSYIGMGYYNTITPSVILRNIFENPGWYTQYTPYQAEISQGRLEALLNFQTVVSDLTGLPIANASLLDEGTAAAEAMAMFYGIKNKRKKGDDIARKFFVSDSVLPQTIDVLFTRAEPIDIEIEVGNWEDFEASKDYFGVLLQYPNDQGLVEDYQAFGQTLNENEIYLTVAADILSLTLLKEPSAWGADAVVGNTQRFGVPLGFGGPHAAYFATKEDFKRQIPGRIIGVSEDSLGNPALRMALQTREQHIRRDKATSNICTAQALLAIMAGMYAVYHGADGLKAIAERIHAYACLLADDLEALGFKNENEAFFDTLFIRVTEEQKTAIQANAIASEINFRYMEGAIGISLDETVDTQAILDIVGVFKKIESPNYNSGIQNGEYASYQDRAASLEFRFPKSLQRVSSYLDHPIFSSHHSESKMMRYIKKLENKDLSLMHSMIPLGSCTMKLNAATELIPVSWASFANIHPFVPANQVAGYYQIFEELEEYLCEITGFQACSLQPNSGAQGEYAGLLAIKAYHEANGNGHRKIALIPSSAHGTNPASAVMVGMKVVVVKCDKHGNISLDDLKAKALAHKDNLGALMVTYPSTHGVFETEIKEICEVIHTYGGRVYMDGANMNAQVGLTSPAEIGADVCHLNLHKTFSIPHGGGGPGMGPICVNDSLAPYLPGHCVSDTKRSASIRAVSSAAWGSASILLISYGYIRLLGKVGILESTRQAILNANYIKARLENYFPVLYTGIGGRAAHELILDLNQYKTIGVQAEDVAKRLMDYGFHAPTLSFPVAGTIMIEPTESESQEELDRFCDAMIAIYHEIKSIESGEVEAKNNVLVNAPHPLVLLTNDTWTFPYTREKAAFPLSYVKENKFWASVARVNNTHGDRNLICTCPPIEEYEMME